MRVDVRLGAVALCALVWLTGCTLSTGNSTVEKPPNTQELPVQAPGQPDQGTQVNTAPSSQVEQLTDSDFELDGLRVRVSSADDVVAKLGKWDRKTDVQAIGRFYSYPKLGLYVMVSFGTFKVLDFYMESNSTFHTARGISVGATQAEVIKAYGQPDRIDDEGGQVLIYSGPKDSRLEVGFQLVDGKVNQIGLGRTPLVWTMPQ